MCPYLLPHMSNTERPQFSVMAGLGPAIHERHLDASRGCPGQARARTTKTECRVSSLLQAGVNIGTGGPPSLGLKTRRTAWPMRIELRSQSTMLVIIVGPSAKV